MLLLLPSLKITWETTKSVLFFGIVPGGWFRALRSHNVPKQNLGCSVECCCCSLMSVTFSCTKKEISFRHKIVSEMKFEPNTLRKPSLASFSDASYLLAAQQRLEWAFCLKSQLCFQLRHLEWWPQLSPRGELVQPRRDRRSRRGQRACQ